MSATKSKQKAATPKATKSAKTSAKKAASKKGAAAKAKGNQKSGDAPRSQLDLEETKKLEAARAKKVQAKAAAGDGKAKKLSAIDAAAQILAGAKEPMNAKQLIEAMAAKGLWTSPGGKTPHATLYSAILREVNEKGKEARFVKTERGKFAAKK